MRSSLTRTVFITCAHAIMGLVSFSSAVAQTSEQTGAVISSTRSTDAASQVRDLKFDFAGADWRSVLDWFAGQAKLNLEWIELPEGEFNLVTERRYSVTESLDIINMHLLTRGFTLIRKGEVLVLAKLGEGFNTALVPRVAPEELEGRGRFEFVKVSFALDWMLAETAVKELDPMLGPYGTLLPMSKTNRIEAMDTVDNLLEIRNLLQREESGKTQERLVTEFVLEHTAPLEIIGKLHQLLGVEKPLARMSNSQMQVVREQIALKAEMTKRLGDKTPSLPESRTDVFLVANEQRNSIVANARPDKIAIIKQAVLALDIPKTNQGARLSEITTMKVYPLNGADPDAVVDILQDLVDVGELHPNARFSEDDDKQILFAFASLKDHVTIMSVMEQLAGSSRSFKVIPLKRLKAGYVARSIQALMGAEVADVSGDGGRRQRNVSAWKGFKVDADVPNNRLFLFATQSENAQVEELLIKIGERSRTANNARVIRVSPENMEGTIEQIRQQWPSVSDSPLDIRLPRRPLDSDSSSALPKRDREDSSPKASYVVFAQPQSSNPGATGGLRQESLITPSPDDRLAPSPPVVLRKSAENELVITSQDPVALEQMESLLMDILPEQSTYSSFYLKHTSPIAVEMKLRQVFSVDGSGAMSSIKFITDDATRSLMVLGAGPTELNEIRDLIQFYDQPAQVDPASERRPRFIRLDHANADAVVRAIKDLYRDYLSVNDRTLVPAGRERAPQPIATATSGLLTIGVDTNTNTVVVSAPDLLGDEIQETIGNLDVPEAATVIRTISVGDDFYSVSAISQLTKLLAQPRAPAESDPRSRANNVQERASPSGDNEANRTRDSSRVDFPAPRVQSLQVPVGSAASDRR